MIRDAIATRFTIANCDRHPLMFLVQESKMQWYGGPDERYDMWHYGKADEKYVIRENDTLRYEITMERYAIARLQLVMNRSFRCIGQLPCDQVWWRSSPLDSRKSSTWTPFSRLPYCNEPLSPRPTAHSQYIQNEIPFYVTLKWSRRFEYRN